MGKTSKISILFSINKHYVDNKLLKTCSITFVLKFVFLTLKYHLLNSLL